MSPAAPEPPDWDAWIRSTAQRRPGGCQRALRNASIRADHRPQYVGVYVVAPSDEGQSVRACAEPPSRPLAPRSGGGAQRRALTAVSTREHCWPRRRCPTTTSCGRPSARNPHISALANTAGEVAQRLPCQAALPLRHRMRRRGGYGGRRRDGVDRRDAPPGDPKKTAAAPTSPRAPAPRVRSRHAEAGWCADGSDGGGPRGRHHPPGDLRIGLARSQDEAGRCMEGAIRYCAASSGPRPTRPTGRRPS